MRSGVVTTILVVGVASIALAAGIWIGRDTSAEVTQQPAAATQPQVATTAPETAVPRDDYQRSLQIFEFKKAAISGPDRGREIFYYKCWFCHNEFAEGGAPDLRTVYQRPQLLSGPAVSDESIKQEIRNGGPGMAAYKYTLSNADLNDLVSFIKSGCCWDNASTPVNPRYRAR
jgi:mono/diheme cytochrome c family protein